MLNARAGRSRHFADPRARSSALQGTVLKRLTFTQLTKAWSRGLLSTAPHANGLAEPRRTLVELRVVRQAHRRAPHEKAVLRFDRVWHRVAVRKPAIHGGRREIQP